MELTESKIKCLLDNNKLSDLNEEAFDKLIRLTLSHVCGKTSVSDLTEIPDVKTDVIRSAYSTIARLLVETARHDTSAEELNSLLRCTALSQSLIEKLCNFYNDYKQSIQDNLESVGSALPHIVDVDWRLDYCIKSSGCKPDEGHVYTVSLSTLKHGNIQSVKFTCTIQQLQELVYKLKDAVRHAEKLTNH